MVPLSYNTTTGFMLSVFTMCVYCTYYAGFKDRHYFSEPRLFHSKMTARSGELASDVLLGRDSNGNHRQSGYKGMRVHVMLVLYIRVRALCGEVQYLLWMPEYVKKQHPCTTSSVY